MATVENVKLGITASATKPDHSDITYSYELHPGEQDCAAQREFTVTVGLWGEDVFDDDVLATDMDEHKVMFTAETPCEPITIERSFELETKVLDEDLFGDDEVFLIVEARSDSGDGLGLQIRVSGKSNTVIGNF
jgi:hypothetical protein